MSILQREEYVIDLQNTTPLLVGWYEPTIADKQGLRASEIKGLWHWWARAFVAGAMYDLGVLKGEGTKNILLKPTREETGVIACIVGRVLGLGYAGREGAEASRFTLSTEYLGRGGLSSRSYEDGLQRIRLLALGGRRVYGYPPGYMFRVVVRRRLKKYDDAEIAALKILVTALQLSGIGKGSRRGLGSLDVKPPEVVKERSFKDLVESTYTSCVEIVNKVISGQIRECSDVVRQLGKLGAIEKVARATGAPPPLPSISKRLLGNLPAAQILIVRNTTFPIIHNFFVRSERCRVLVGSSICNDDLRNNLAAWVLGLPRGRVREGEGTGYLIRSKDVSRRASPVFISFHGRFNVFDEGVYISLLLSGDWPTRLEWFGGGRSTNITIDVKSLHNAYNVAITELKEYLKKVNATIQQIWP